MFTLRVDEEIVLRLHDMAHLHNYYRLIDTNREHLGEFLDWVKNYSHVTDVRRYIRQMRRAYGKGDLVDTQVFYKGSFAGGIALFINQPEPTIGEIGYWLGEEFTGKGIITRAVRRLLDYAFSTWQLHKVIIRCSTANDASRAVPERLGFQHEATLVKHIQHGDTYDDIHQYYMLAADWVPETIAPDFSYLVADDDGDRIELRLPRKADAPALFTLTDENRAYLREWLPWLDDVTTINDSLAYISGTLTRYGKNNGWNALITYNDALAGVVGYHYWDHRNKKTELGYWLAEDYTGQGIMTRCVAALVDYAFEVVGLHRVEIPCAAENTASCAIPQRLGFTHEGVIRHAEYLYDHYVDWNMYAMLSSEWASRDLSLSQSSQP